VPVEVEAVDVAQHLRAAGRQNRFHHHRLAAQMHVRLEALDAPRLLHDEEALSALDRVRRNVDAAGAHEVQDLTELWLLAFRVEVDPELDVVGDLLAGRGVVNVPDELRTGQQQLAGVGAHDLALLADRPFHEESGTGGDAAVVVVVRGRRVVDRIVLRQPGERVVDDFATLVGGGTNFDGAHPARFGDAGRRRALVPGVLRVRGQGERRRLDDEIGWTAEQLGEVPDRGVGPLDRRRHVLRIAHRRATVHPLGDRLDLAIGQRSIVLELLNADVLVDVPRRHLARHHACLDRLRPRPRLLIGGERHGRHRVGPVARLALGLENRRDVLCEGRRFRRVRRAGGASAQCHRTD
jgi:hypothetical protein